jgi:hypothetical protein
MARFSAGSANKLGRGRAVWGGGRRAASAGLLDERIDAQIIYNVLPN